MVQQVTGNRFGLRLLVVKMKNLQLVSKFKWDSWQLPGQQELEDKTTTDSQGIMAIIADKSTGCSKQTN